MKAYVFPGQGAQFVGMGKDLYENSSIAKELFAQSNEILGFSITDIMFDGTPEQLKEIDYGLLSFCSNKFPKVAKIVGSYMTSNSNKFDVIDLFYAQRIEKMVHLKSLESQGNLKFMRYSEVRLAKT